MLFRFRRSDDGSVAVLAAVTFPVVLLCVGLALAAVVWSSSEHEAQRAADTAAVQTAARAFLGTDKPALAALDPASYPTLPGVPALAPCETVGVDPTAVLPPGVTLPVGCAGVGPYAPPVAAAFDTAQTACDVARAAMAPEHASYGNRFFRGTGDSQPSCASGRIRVKRATGTPLVGDLGVATPATYDTVATTLAAQGVHLDTALPAMACPEVSVEIDQPVREPVFDRFAIPNGRATAQRVVKNAVVVPVYEGRAIPGVRAPVSPNPGGPGVVVAANPGASIPPQNLNTTLLAGQRELLPLLDEVDAVSNAALRAVDPSLGRLSMTQCLRRAMAQVYDPPSGDAATADDTLGNAAATGEVVIAVQVGVVPAACGTPGAIPNPATGTCLRAATSASTVTPAGGAPFYEIPFFDATPVIVRDAGQGNYQAVPVDVTQAAGAFRAALVRDAGDDRYDADVRVPVRQVTCDPPGAPALTPVPTAAPSSTPSVLPSSVCGILLATPTAVPTAVPTATPTLTPMPTPSPTVSVCVGLTCVVTP